MECHEMQDEVETGTVASVSEAEDPGSSEAETPLLESMEQAMARVRVNGGTAWINLYAIAKSLHSPPPAPAHPGSGSGG